MKIEDFILDNKLVIPENEIDNVYIWTRISKTQEVLMPTASYYKLAKHSFDADTDKVLQVLKEKLPAATRESYTFADYITFTMNRDKIFNDKMCFAYMSNMPLLTSLAGYLAHTMNRFLPEEDSLGSLIINKIDEPDRFTKIMDADFVILNVYAALPEHKYRSAILDMLLTRRCKPGLCTLIYTLNTNLLIGPELIPNERAKNKKLVNLTPLSNLFNERRNSSYQALMKDWITMMGYSPDTFVYSKTAPQEKIRIIDRYK